MNILIVGSSVIDLFLKISDPTRVKQTKENVSFSLGDKIPTSVEKLTLGGNGANVSVGLRRLELQTTFYTYLGTDILSQHITNVIQAEGVNLIVEKREEEVSSLSLIFNFDTDRIIFSHHPKRTHNFRYHNSSDHEYVYLTAIGMNWEESYSKVVQFSKNNNSSLIFSPGSYELKDLTEVFYKTLSASSILFLNKEEAEHILKHSKVEYSGINDILQKLGTLGPELISITDGENGAYARDDKRNIYKISSFGGKATEKTGAGDAYTSGFLAAYFIGKNIPECMRWGTFNATSVMTHMGAQDGLLRSDELQKKLAENSEFRAVKI